MLYKRKGSGFVTNDDESRKSERKDPRGFGSGTLPERFEKAKNNRKFLVYSPQLLEYVNTYCKIDYRNFFT
jgi:hypothetical protein